MSDLHLATEPAAPPAARAARRRMIRAEQFKGLFSRYKILALLIAIAVLWSLFTWATDGDFLTARNLSNLLRQMAITGMLASGMVFVIVSGEIDLSVGSLLGLLGGLAAILDNQYHLPFWANMPLVLLLGVLIGAFNGYWVAYLRIPSFIVTLAGLLAWRGVLLGVTGGITITPISSTFVAISQSYLPNFASYILGLAIFGTLAFTLFRNRVKRAEYGLSVPSMGLDIAKLVGIGVAIIAFFGVLDAYRGVPLPVLIVLVLLGLFTLMARRTVFGRRIYAIGGNLEATRLSGVNVQLIKLCVFALMGAMAALAGIATTARLAAGSPSAGSLQELDAIASCIIGGTSMRGGVGTVFGALIGALIMASLDNGMSMLGVDTYWQMIVKGVILLLAVWLDVATTQKR
ncbi:sugar ABC transporter permease [Kozakia baliensis]|nr:sugar ABC transporter permease [Kozakia baliensis]GBR27246.1 D-xylose ABC transporter permease [Kozakia baliensis NRIC 0488]GEL64108.1 D-xylose ABC transporter permease [Kozakia baliensis]